MTDTTENNPPHDTSHDPRGIERDIETPAPVELGSLLFTSIDPRRGHEVEYNRWYEYDHFYAGCMVGPWQFAGRRYVATRRLKDLRSPDNSPMSPPDAASYLSIYWVLKGFHDEWARWAVDKVHGLHGNGRMFEQRDHIHTALYEHHRAEQREPRGTSIELALDRDFAGLVVTACELADDTTIEQFDAWSGDWLAGAFDADWGPEVVGTSTLLPLPGDAPGDVPGQSGSDRRVLQLHFLTRDPEEGWTDGYARWGADVASANIGTHIWTAPYIPTVMGTDTYTDELW